MIAHQYINSNQQCHNNSVGRVADSYPACRWFNSTLWYQICAISSDGRARDFGWMTELVMSKGSTQGSWNKDYEFKSHFSHHNHGVRSSTLRWRTKWHDYWSAAVQSFCLNVSPPSFGIYIVSHKIMVKCVSEASRRQKERYENSFNNVDIV